MSRLNYMTEEDEALVAIHEDLAVLERRRVAGHELSPDQQAQLRALAGRLILLVDTVDWDNDEEPLPAWLRPLQSRSDPAAKRKAHG